MNRTIPLTLTQVAHVCLLVTASATTLSAYCAPVTVNWSGPGSGDYGTAANWSTGKVPLNGGANAYIAYVAPGKTIGYAIAGANSVDGLLLDAGSSIGFTSPSLILPNSLSVLGKALFGGSVSADTTALDALGVGTDFIGNVNTASAVNGAVVRIGATHFSASGLANRNILNAAGAGSLLALTTVAKLDAGFANGNLETVTATNGGTIDLSGATSIIAPTGANQTLQFTASNAGSIRLASLQSVSGATLDTGYTGFNADAASIVIGPLQKANRMIVTLNNGATMTMGGYAGAASLTNSTFAVGAGSLLDASTLKGDYATGFGNTTLMSASGKDARLVLSGLRSIDVGAAPGNVDVISASNLGVVDLSAVTKTIGPAGGSQTLQFSATGGGVIRLPSLQVVSGATLDSGYTGFSADAATIVLGPLQAANRMTVTLNNGAKLTMGGYAGQASLTNSAFAVGAGSLLDASTLKGDYASGFGNTTLMSASGKDARLVFSGLKSIDISTAPGSVDAISASNFGVVDLSAVTKTIGPAGGSQTLQFNATGGGAIRLPSLQAITGATQDTGYTTFNADGGSIAVGPLQKANRMVVALNNGATMTMGGYAGQASLTNSTFAIGTGALLDASTLKGDYATGFGNTTLMSASGKDARLILSGLRSIDTSAAGGSFDSISANGSGLIDLSGLKSIVTPGGGSQVLNFNATDGGRIVVGNLQTPPTANRGHLAFNVATSGQIQLGGFTADSGVHFNMADAGSQISVLGNLALLAGSTVSAGPATRISFTGGFSFAQKTASQINTDLALLDFVGTGLHTLEVGGKRLGALADKTVVSGNFAIGELTVGRAGGAAGVLELVDDLDNGNRAGGIEVLYLNGVGGAGNGNGLHILAGSTLVLGGMDLYTTEAGRWVHVNDLFRPGIQRIAYDQGFIALDVSAVPEPGTWAMMAAGLWLLTLGARRSKAAARVAMA